jgi:hypothetical protein
VILIAAVPIAGLAYLAQAFADASRDWHRREVQRGQKDLERQLAALKSGQGSFVYLYGTRETDALLGQLEGNAEVKELSIELTDVSEAGMASVATLPRLRRLVLYGGWGITDGGLAMLRGMTGLEVLELKNTQVTNNGLRAVCDLPNLRSLAIFCEPRLRTLDDAGLVHLKDMPKLEVLSLTGGWASWKAIGELKTRLPNCKVVTDAVSSSPTIER